MAEPRCRLRPAQPDDVPVILELIRELAVYEKLESACVATQPQIHDALFGPRPHAEVIIAELDGTPVGFALFFHNFSTFRGRPGLYLEDVFVRPTARGLGVGKALLARLARIAVERGCARFEWSVLDWNTPAIEFYRRLGAEPLAEWTVFRLADQALHDLAAQDG